MFIRTYSPTFDKNHRMEDTTEQYDNVSNVITFKRSDQKLPMKEKSIHCRHINVEVDEDERDLRCTTCNARVDPFNYILQHANRERSALQDIWYKEREAKELGEKIYDLKQEIQRLQAQKRRLTK